MIEIPFSPDDAIGRKGRITWRHDPRGERGGRPVELQTDGAGHLIEVPLCRGCYRPLANPRAWWCPPCRKKQRAVYRRQYAESHREERAEYEARNRETIRQSHSRSTAKRRVAARQFAHDWQTKYVGLHCSTPRCQSCGDEVPYVGMGRPRLDDEGRCRKCRPYQKPKWNRP